MSDRFTTSAVLVKSDSDSLLHFSVYETIICHQLSCNEAEQTVTLFMNKNIHKKNIARLRRGQSTVMNILKRFQD